MPLNPILRKMTKNWKYFGKLSYKPVEVAINLILTENNEWDSERLTKLMKGAGVVILFFSPLALAITIPVAIIGVIGTTAIGLTSLAYHGINDACQNDSSDNGLDTPLNTSSTADLYGTLRGSSSDSSCKPVSRPDLGIVYPQSVLDAGVNSLPTSYSPPVLTVTSPRGNETAAYQDLETGVIAAPRSPSR